MSNFVSRSLQSAFLAATLVLGTVPVYAEEAGPEKDDQKISVNKDACAEKPIYEMNFEELMALARRSNEGYEKAWAFYEFYQLRQLRLETRVWEGSVDRLIAQIDVLDHIDPGKPIKIIIDSKGGSIDEGLRLYRKFKSSPSPIHTHVDGQASSMGALLLIAGDARTATPESWVLIHQVSGSTDGTTSYMAHELDHLIRQEHDLLQIVVDNTGLSMEDARRIAAADVYYSASEALALGFLDRVVEDSKPEKNIAPGSRRVPQELLPENRIKGFYTGAFGFPKAPVPRTPAPPGS